MTRIAKCLHSVATALVLVLGIAPATAETEGGSPPPDWYRGSRTASRTP